MQLTHDQLELQERLALLLRAHRTIRFCDDCLALRTGAFPREVRDARLVIDRRYGFQLTDGVCSDCLQSRAVVYAAANP